MKRTIHGQINDRIFQALVEPDNTGNIDIEIEGTAKNVSIISSDDSLQSNLVYEIDGCRYIVDMVNTDDGRGELWVNNRPFNLINFDPRLNRSLGNGRASGGGDDDRHLRAEMPGKVVEIRVQEGETLETGAVILTIEAMKMENQIFAPRQLSVDTIHVTQGQSVEKGQILVDFSENS